MAPFAYRQGGGARMDHILGDEPQPRPSGRRRLARGISAMVGVRCVGYTAFGLFSAAKTQALIRLRASAKVMG